MYSNFISIIITVPKDTPEYSSILCVARPIAAAGCGWQRGQFQEIGRYDEAEECLWSINKLNRKTTITASLTDEIRTPNENVYGTHNTREIKLPANDIEVYTKLNVKVLNWIRRQMLGSRESTNWLEIILKLKI